MSISFTMPGKPKVCLSLVALLLLTACKNDEQPVYNSFSGLTQGTTYSITYDNKGGFDPAGIRMDVEEILYNFDMSLSLYRDSSIISKINRNEDVVADRFFTEVYNKSVLISEMTGGAFDITVGPLVKAWGFGPDGARNFTDEKHDSLMTLVGMDKISLTEGRIVKSDPDISVDANAIAQGYSVDVLFDYFEELGINSFLIEIGGEVRTKGDKAGSPWRIGIDRPEDNNLFPGENLQAVIELSDRALATSGNYRKFYVEDGVKYSHTIDPRTGYPAKNTLLSATIVTGECSTADGIATACMVMGTDRAKEFVINNPEFDAFFVYSDEKGNYNTWMSEKLKKTISEY